MTLETELVQTHVGKVQVHRGGSGRPVVYLHSATGEGVGLPYVDSLAERYEVIAPMFPGYGESEGIDDIDDMEDVTFHLLDLFDVLGLTAPVVSGTSLGGWMALELATRYPEKVSKLVLVNPVGLHFDEAPINELFGRTPGELADMLFADQNHPLAAALHQMDAFAGDVGKET